jgi:hypothetical protein
MRVQNVRKGLVAIGVLRIPLVGALEGSGYLRLP